MIDPKNIRDIIQNILDDMPSGFKNLPTDLQKYFKNIGLGGLMVEAFGKGKQGSPLAALEVFDIVYQKKTGDASLFDKT